MLAHALYQQPRQAGTGADRFAGGLHGFRDEQGLGLAHVLRPHDHADRFGQLGPVLPRAGPAHRVALDLEASGSNELAQGSGGLDEEVPAAHRCGDDDLTDLDGRTVFDVDDVEQLAEAAVQLSRRRHELGFGDGAELEEPVPAAGHDQVAGLVGAQPAGRSGEGVGDAGDAPSSGVALAAGAQPQPGAVGQVEAPVDLGPVGEQPEVGVEGQAVRRDLVLAQHVGQGEPGGHGGKVDELVLTDESQRTPFGVDGLLEHLFDPLAAAVVPPVGHGDLGQHRIGHHIERGHAVVLLDDRPPGQGHQRFVQHERDRIAREGQPSPAPKLRRFRGLPRPEPSQLH